MRMYYKTLQNFLDDTPRTTRQLTEMIYPELESKQIRLKARAVETSLRQLKQDNIAVLIRDGNKQYWIRSKGPASIRMTPAERIIKFLGDGEWHSTSEIADGIYDDIDEPFKRGVYMSRTSAQLHRLRDKGLVCKDDRHLDRRPFAVNWWRLEDGVTV